MTAENAKAVSYNIIDQKLTTTETGVVVV